MTAEPGRVRALTWNVHSYIGRGRRRDPDAIVTALRQLDADVIALQEIDDRRREPGEESGFDALKDVFGHHGVDARTVRSEDGDYGHLLMSRWPISESEELDLAVGRREPRRAISCRVESPAGPIRVLAAHLGLSAGERRRQIESIRQHLETTVERAAIVLGDFNEWRRVGVATRVLCPPFEIAAARASYPARRPILALDRIWCRSPLAPFAAIATTAYRDLSDHLPVLAELQFL